MNVWLSALGSRLSALGFGLSAFGSRLSALGFRLWAFGLVRIVDVPRRMDDDLERMSRDQLVAEVKKLRAGIRHHRDSLLHELCWHHPDLWSLLPEKTDPVPVVPSWPAFLRGCVKYRESLDEQAPHAPRSSQPYPDG